MNQVKLILTAALIASGSAFAQSSFANLSMGNNFKKDRQQTQTAALMASSIVQASFGNFSMSNNNETIFKKGKQQYVCTLPTPAQQQHLKTRYWYQDASTTYFTCTPEYLSIYPDGKWLGDPAAETIYAAQYLGRPIERVRVE